ncbi:FAD-binding oxidoreductase [Pontibacterium granulatum]|uniref:NAD(P)/FAD-dependent oxidoreductase n=1 Tax=Pontibacterium granulatum TaxID=2036029 RepID=UPI00249BE8CE|nr:FAD-binding oxidoreductase [Pontibacterium granulatum]MDI3324858.1 FAD-binding oxidoreductase [Pontibacterium granulatum]
MALPPYVDSYYASTINRELDLPELQGEHSCDVCVVGAGFTGLSTSIHLAQKGYKVILLEGSRIGWGASGRNGGQAIIGYNNGIGALEQRFGLDDTRKYLEFVLEGCQIIRDFITEFDIDCDLKDGHAGLATSTRQFEAMKHEQAVWARCGHDDIIVKDGFGAVHEMVGSDNYLGTYFDPNGAHLHPLNLACGEAKGLLELGGQIFENSRVTRVDQTMNPKVYTNYGVVNAKQVVLCGNAYMGELVPEMEAKLVPVSSFIITTEQLPDEVAQDVIRKDYGFCDWNYILDYYRMTADQRLLFGGESFYGGKEPRNIAQRLRNNMLKVFPQLQDVKVSHSWGGNFAITYSRMPDVGRLKNSNIFYAHGYSGTGITTTHIMGRLLAEAVSGTSERFDVFERVPQMPMPGGKLFKVPAVIMGSWYYLLRDKLGASRK